METLLDLQLLDKGERWYVNNTVLGKSWVSAWIWLQIVSCELEAVELLSLHGLSSEENPSALA